MNKIKDVFFVFFRILGGKRTNERNGDIYKINIFFFYISRLIYYWGLLPTYILTIYTNSNYMYFIFVLICFFLAYLGSLDFFNKKEEKK